MSKVVCCKYKVCLTGLVQGTDFPPPLPSACLFEEIVAKRGFLHDQL